MADVTTRSDSGKSPLDAQLDPADAGFDSLAAQQLRKGFPWLRFRAPLEQEFRVAYRDQIRGQMRVNLWLGLGLIAAITLIERFAFAQELNEGLDPLRVAAIIPALLAVLIVTYTRHYSRFFDPMVQV